MKIRVDKCYLFYYNFFIESVPAGIFIAKSHRRLERIECKPSRGNRIRGLNAYWEGMQGRVPRTRLLALTKNQ